MMNRRDLGIAAGGALGALTIQHPGKAAGKSIRVTVWDERQPAQKEAYENFLGNAIADHLRSFGSDFEVRSVGIDDPNQGLGPDMLSGTDVLIWWGHQRHGEIKTTTAAMIVDQIIAGKLSLLALHSAHWAVPFIEAMNARSLQDAMASLSPSERKTARVKNVAAPKRLMRRDEALTPSFTKTLGADGVVEIELRLPSCVFPAVRNDGKPGHLKTLLPKHPIARGIPAEWDIPKTEMYDEPFHVPTPDAVVFEETWPGGERFRSGCLWKLGKGQVFYFRPGHETYPIFKQQLPLKVVENAVRFLGKK